MAKPILVTGWSSGIGRTVAESPSEAWCTVYATVRTEEDSGELERIPGVHPLMMDMTDEDQVRRGIAEIARAGEGL